MTTQKLSSEFTDKMYIKNTCTISGLLVTQNIGTAIHSAIVLFSLLNVD